LNDFHCAGASNTLILMLKWLAFRPLSILSTLWVSLLFCLTFGCMACASQGRTPTSDSTRAVEPIMPLPADRATLELHSHLFMKEGMTWAFRGDFDGPLQAKNWKAKFSTEANPETLDRSEIGVLVVALYAHPLFVTNLRESIRRQIKLAEQFVAEHPHWVIARDSTQVRVALSEGKRALIFALEGADGIIDNEEDLREFVDEKGIRIVTLLHLTDDQYGGVAFLSGIKALSSPWAWLTQLFHPVREDGHRLNANGLSDKGRAMAQALIKRHVWIDLAHASDLSARALIEMQEKENLPILYTHTPLRKYLGAERGISAWQLAQIKKTSGVLGIMPSEEMMEGTVIPAGKCAADCKLPCEGGIQAFSVQYSEMVAAVGADLVSTGSDYNGGIPHLHPSCPVGSGLDAEGLWNIGQHADLWGALEKTGAPVPSPRRRMVDHFLEAWARVNPPR
jgi:microsomal dipeptidase-like Zn-dependent dipeptidase